MDLMLTFYTKCFEMVSPQSTSTRECSNFLSGTENSYLNSTSVHNDTASDI